MTGVQTCALPIYSWYQTNKERKAIRRKEYENKPEWKKKEAIRRKQYNSKYRKKRNFLQRKYRQENPRYKINHSIGSGIWKVLKKKKAGKSWEKLVGYTTEELIEHLKIGRAHV